MKFLHLKILRYVIWQVRLVESFIQSDTQSDFPFMI